MRWSSHGVAVRHTRRTATALCPRRTSMPTEASNHAAPKTLHTVAAAVAPGSAERDAASTARWRSGDTSAFSTAWVLVCADGMRETLSVAATGSDKTPQPAVRAMADASGAATHSTAAVRATAARAAGRWRNHRMTTSAARPTSVLCQAASTASRCHPSTATRFSTSGMTFLLAPGFDQMPHLR